MNIVIEGCDASGKSTLAKRMLAAKLGTIILHSDGPPKSSEEINTRARMFLRQQKAIFDRHPCVGEEMYCVLRGGKSLIDPNLVRQFYESNPIIVYCSGQAGVHREKAGEDPRHLKALISHHVVIKARYENWAIQRAHFIYRVGDNWGRIVKAIAGVMQP